MEKIRLEKLKYPKLVTDLATQNHYLKILTYSLIGVATLMIVVVAFVLKQGPTVIALDPTGTVASVSQELHVQHVQAAVREYLQHRYNWNVENVQSELKKSEAFIFPTLTNSFQKSMLEIQKYVKDRKVSQRVYPQSISVSLKDKTVTVVADRITEFEALKAATILKTKLTFDLDSPTPSNPWGIFFVKEVEGGDAQ